MDTFTKRAAPGQEWTLEVEAAGLRWLAEANGAAVVPVVSQAPGELVLQRVPVGTASAGAADRFGHDLATTHRAGAPSYGSPPPGCGERLTIGEAELAMHPHDSFGRYAAEQLVMPFARTARLDTSGMAVLERLCDRLVAGEFDDDVPPARIHGDLWSGNVLWTDRGVVVIDPAAHGGHPITDLAMLALFGAPHLDRIHAACAEAHGLPTGWEDLVPLHQVWPLLVHATLFGGGYGSRAVAAARRYA